jgi:exosortase
MRRALAAALAGGLVWLYADAARGLVVQWATSPDASYGAILAGVALIVLWRRRGALAARPSPPIDAALGALVTAVGFGAFLVGLAAADLFTARASFVVVAGGLVWLLAGRRALAAAFVPLLFLLLAIPLPDLVVTTLTSSLQTVAARSAEATLTAAGIAVYRDGNVLQLPSTTLQIAEACSGLRSAVSLVSVGVLLAWATEGSRPRQVLLVAATVPIAVVANGLRVAATGAAAEAWGPVMTRDPWHALAGWLTFVVSLAALWLLRRLLLPAGRVRAGVTAEPCLAGEAAL